MSSRLVYPTASFFTLSKSGAAALALIAGLAQAQQAPAETKHDMPSVAGSQLDAVVVTGTRVPGRTVLDSESPIDILSSADLKRSGSSELATVLARLLPSLNFPRPSVTDASDAVRPAQLRGLAPDQVLVLVNGKRRHSTAIVNVQGSQGRGSAPVDLNAIPIDAIDHVEVLRDGAAAQYGSDAIAGVINIILRSGFKGGVAHADAGTNWAGDGQNIALGTSAGILRSDKAWLRLSLEHRDADPSNRAGPDLRDPKEPRYGQINQRQGDPASKANSLLLNGEWQLGADLLAYGYGQWSQRDTTSPALWRTAATAKPVSALYPEGFLPLEQSQSEDRSLVLGLRNQATEGWRWDLSLNHGGNDFNLDINNSANLSLGNNSPTRFHLGRLQNSQTVLNADAARELSLGLSAPATLALGAEARSERYAIEAGEEKSYSGSGAQGFSGFRPVNAGVNSRHSEAVYANLEAPLTQRLGASLAWRGERYSDFGSAQSWKLSGRWAAAQALALRATASTGFRAPSLAQQNYTITTTNFIIINGVSTPVETGTFAVGSAAAAALGAQALKAEKSKNFSLGGQFTPSRDLSLSVDLYQIDIQDRILFSSNLVLPSSLQQTLAAQGVVVGAARYFTNAVDTRTRGVDVLANWRSGAWSWGQTDLSLGYNYNKNTVLRVADNPALLTANRLTLIDRQTIGRATVASPRDKLSLALNHEIGALGLRLNATRYGEFTVPQNNQSLDQVYSPAWVLDLGLDYRIGGWRYSLGLDNLTDRYPDKVTSAGNLNSNGILPYSNFSPFGFNGRQAYAKAAFSW